jgi:hypothetical protein
MLCIVGYCGTVSKWCTVVKVEETEDSNAHYFDPTYGKAYNLARKAIQIGNITHPGEYLVNTRHNTVIKDSYQHGW